MVLTRNVRCLAPNVTRRGLVVVAVVALLATACSGDGQSGGPSDEDLARAEAFRIELVRTTGHHHLSMSDHLSIAEHVCDVGVVGGDWPNVVERWGFGRTGHRNAIFDAATIACPESVAAEAPPFPPVGSSLRPPASCHCASPAPHRYCLLPSHLRSTQVRLMRFLK